MSEFGRWRDGQEREFEAWWKKTYGTHESRNGPIRGSEVDYRKYPEGHKVFEASSQDDEELARIVARNAWMAARHRDSPG